MNVRPSRVSTAAAWISTPEMIALRGLDLRSCRPDALKPIRTIFPANVPGGTCGAELSRIAVQELRSVAAG